MINALIILAANTAAAVADTVAKKVTFAEKLQKMSNMSIDQLLQTLTTNLFTVAQKLIVALIVFFIGRWIIGRVRAMLRRIMERRGVDLSLRTFVLSLVKVALTILLIIIIISIIGIDTTSFVALFASAGLAIGMALSGTLQNFAGGVIILVLRPFRVGDVVEMQGQIGTIKEIQLFNTVINTPDNKTVMIPNGGISTGIINNYSREDKRRVEWKLGIAYGDDYDKAKAIISRLLDADERVLRDPEYFIALHTLGASSVDIVVRAWVPTDEYWNVYFNLNEQVYKVFAQEGINIPFPQMDVHIVSNKQARTEERG